MVNKKAAMYTTERENNRIFVYNSSAGNNLFRIVRAINIPADGNIIYHSSLIGTPLFLFFLHIGNPHIEVNGMAFAKIFFCTLELSNSMKSSLSVELHISHSIEIRLQSSVYKILIVF